MGFLKCAAPDRLQALANSLDPRDSRDLRPKVGQRYASLLWYRDPEHLRARRCARGARWREFAGLVRHVLHPRRIGSLFGRWGAWSLFLEGRERRKCSHWSIRPTARRRSNCGKSAGGASLATALHAVDANGAMVVFGNSSGEMTSISFADFRGGQNARLQSFFSFTSGAGHFGALCFSPLRWNRSP